LIGWYVSYALSYRDIEEIMLERGIKVDHSTLNCWVIEYEPLLEHEFRNNHKKKTGSSWRMDETYIKIKGNTVDFILSNNRDEPAAKAIFTKAIGSSGIPERIIIDKSSANKAGINAINLPAANTTAFEQFYALAA